MSFLKTAHIPQLKYLTISDSMAHTIGTMLPLRESSDRCISALHVTRETIGSHPSVRQKYTLFIILHLELNVWCLVLQIQ